MNEGEEGKKGVCIGGQREHRERCTQGGNVRKGLYKKQMHKYPPMVILHIFTCIYF